MNPYQGNQNVAPALYLNDPVQTPWGSGIVYDWNEGQTAVCVKYARDKYRWLDRSSVTHKAGL